MEYKKAKRREFNTSEIDWGGESYRSYNSHRPKAKEYKLKRFAPAYHQQKDHAMDYSTKGVDHQRRTSDPTWRKTTKLPSERNLDKELIQVSTQDFLQRMNQHFDNLIYLVKSVRTEEVLGVKEEPSKSTTLEHKNNLGECLVQPSREISNSSIMHLSLPKGISAGQEHATKQDARDEDLNVVMKAPREEPSYKLNPEPNDKWEPKELEKGLEKKQQEHEPQRPNEDKTHKMVKATRAHQLQGSHNTPGRSRGVILSYLIKEEPPDPRIKPYLNRNYQIARGKLLNSHLYEDTNLLYLCAGEAVSRTKPFQGGGYDEDIQPAVPPGARPSAMKAQGIATTFGMGCTGCTAGLDPRPIGNSGSIPEVGTVAPKILRLQDKDPTIAAPDPATLFKDIAFVQPRPFKESLVFLCLKEMTHFNWEPGDHLEDVNHVIRCTTPHLIRRIKLELHLPYLAPFALIQQRLYFHNCCWVLDDFSTFQEVPKTHNYLPKLSRYKPDAKHKKPSPAAPTYQPFSPARPELISTSLVDLLHSFSLRLGFVPIGFSSQGF